MSFLGTRNNRPKVGELKQLWDTTWRSHRTFEEAFDVAQARIPDGTICMDDRILVRPRNHDTEQLLVALDLDSPEKFLGLYGQELQGVPVVGKVRPNKLPYLGIKVNKRNMIALLTGFNEEIQIDILQGMHRVEEAFWTSSTVTAYLAERRAGGLKEIPPALLARKRAVNMAVEHLLTTTPKIQTIRLGGIGVGSGDEMVQIGQMLMAKGKSVEVRALELNHELVSEANRALQEAQIAGEVVHGSMNTGEDLQRICLFKPHLIVDHWAGCYDSLPIQKARFALIREQLPQTAILFAAITDEWGVGKMIAGEKQRNTETVQALLERVEQVVFDNIIGTHPA